MRKMLVALSIFIVIFTLWQAEQQSIKKICTEMPQRLEEIEYCIRENNIPKATELTEGFKTEWEKKEAVLDVLTPHDDTDEINLNIVRLERYLEIGEGSLVIGVIDEINEHFREINKKISVHYTNIF